MSVNLFEFGERLNHLRTEKGLSQEKVAQELGYSKGAISFYELGKRTPDIIFLDAAAKYFDVSFDYLLGRTTNKTSDPDLSSVCRYTGLSENAIIKLRYYAQMSETQNAALQAAKKINQERSEGKIPAYGKISRELFSKGYVLDPEQLIDCILFTSKNESASILTPNVVIDYFVSSDDFDKLLSELSDLMVDIYNNELDEKNREFEVWKIHQTLYSISADIVESIQEKTQKEEDGDPNG